MRKRDAGSAPATGDRVPYVIIKGVKCASVASRDSLLSVLTPFQLQRLTRKRKIPSTFWNITFRLILSITSTTNLPNLWKGFSSPSWARKSVDFVCVPQSSHTITDAWTVNGDHTRTVSIATPTTGGLMKFAVKTTNCLGCKTPLKPTNSRPSRCLV
jgi:DNA polymerase delta subunit 1